MFMIELINALAKLFSLYYSSTYEYILSHLFSFKNSLPDMYMVAQNLRNLWFSLQYKFEMQDIHDTQ